MLEYYTEQGYHIIHIPNDTELNYIACFFRNASRSSRAHVMAHLAEHILVDIFRDLMNLENQDLISYQYVGAYTTKDYMCFYTYDFHHMYRTIRVINKFVSMVINSGIPDDLIGHYMNREVKNIQRERFTRKTRVLSEIENIFFNVDYEVGNDDIDTITVDEIMKYIQLSLHQVDIIIVGKFLPEDLHFFNYPDVVSDKTLLQVPQSIFELSEDLHPFQLYVRLPVVQGVSDSLIAQAFQFYLCDRLKEQKCFWGLSGSLKMLLSGESYIYIEGRVSASHCRIDEHSIIYWVEHIDVHEFKRKFEEARYRMLLTLDHSDVQAMWAYKAYSFSGSPASREDICSAKLEDKEIYEYAKRILKKVKVIFNEG